VNDAVYTILNTGTHRFVVLKMEMCSNDILPLLHFEYTGGRFATIFMG
jgi:hypothetical protein